MKSENLYRAKEITQTVYKNIMNSKKTWRED